MRGVQAVSEWLPFIVVGIANGSVYALAGMGLVLTFKTSGVFNFAHGAQAALAAYLFHEFRVVRGLPWPLAASIALVLVGGVGGLLLERLGTLLSNVETASRIVATVGLLVGIQGLLIVAYGPATIPFDHFLPTRTIDILGVSIRYEQIIVFALVLCSAVALFYLLDRTRSGVAMHAVVDDPLLLGLAATDPTSVRRRAWLLGSTFASVSGMLLAPTLGLDVTILTLLVFFAFGAAAVGAFSSLVWTYVGGIGIGIGAALFTKVIADLESPPAPLAALPSTLPFVVLFVVLLVMPTDRLVTRAIRSARRIAVIPKPSRTELVAGIAVTIVASVALPHVVGGRLPLYTQGLAFVVLFASLVLLVRTSNQVSLCHMTFAALGASTFSHVVAAGVPWILAVIAGGLAAMVGGAIVAFPAIRLSGVYLAIATFGFALLVERLLFPSFVMFGQNLQRAAPRPAFASLDGDVGYYYVVLAVAASCVAGIAVIRNGRLGRLLRALGESPTALAAHGADPRITRLIVFCLSAFLAGVAGAIIGPITGSASAQTSGFQVSLLIVAVLFVAGRRPMLGPIIAAMLYVVGPGYVTEGDLLEWMPVAFGSAAIIAVTLRLRTFVDRLRADPRVQERMEASPVRERMEVAARDR